MATARSPAHDWPEQNSQFGKSRRTHVPAGHKQNVPLASSPVQTDAVFALAVSA